MNSVKRHSCELKNSQVGHDLPISVKDKVILPFREGFVFTKFREKKIFAKISEFTVVISFENEKQMVIFAESIIHIHWNATKTSPSQNARIDILWNGKQRLIFIY